MGIAQKIAQVYISEFGYAKRYFDILNNEHIEFRKDKTPIGTAKFVSVNTHKGYGKISIISFAYLLRII